MEQSKNNTNKILKEKRTFFFLIYLNYVLCVFFIQPKKKYLYSIIEAEKHEEENEFLHYI